MSHEPDGSQSIHAEDIETLERIVQRYTDGNASKSQTIEDLSVSVATICTEQNIVPDASIIHPYLEQLDAHDREIATAEARSGTADTRLHGDGNGSGQAHSGTQPNPDKRSAGMVRNSDDEENEGEEERPSKKPRADPSKFSWNDQTKIFLDSFTVTPAHERVREQVAAYNIDIKTSLRDLDTSYGKPSFPRSQWKNVLLDGYVEFNEIFSNSFTTEPDESDLLVIGDTHLEFQKPKLASKIKKATQWNSAWRVYEQAVKFAFKGRDLELERYWKHINDLFEARHESTHEFIINYDRAVRIYVGGRRDILLHEVEKFTHIKEAHLSPSGVFVVSHPSGSISGGGGKGKRKRTEVCKNFNFRQCSRPDCSYKHICIFCQSSDHVGPKCPKRLGSSA